MLKTLNKTIDQEICLTYNSFNMSVKEIALKYNTSVSKIYRVLKEYNIPKVRLENNCYQEWRSKISPKDHAKIIAQYKSGLSSIEIAKPYNVTPECIQYILNKYNVEMREKKYLLRDTFFEKIDTEEKAYFLGFLFADGHNNVKKKQISLRLAEKDKEILDKLNNIIFISERPLYYAKGKIAKIVGQWSYQTPSYCLEIHSTKVSEDLEKLGCGPDKNIKLLPENLDREMFRHFLRGYFDGDGCLCVNYKKVKQSHVRIAMRKLLGLQVIKELSKYLNINIQFYHSNTSEVLYYLAVGGSLQVKTFMDFIYKDAKIFLKRKDKKYKDFNELYAKRPHKL
jgi:intein-encoded DNA endonuclease-like protein